MTARRTLAALAALALLTTPRADAQEARRRWEMQRQIRLDKFEQILPLAMKNNDIDMWLVAVKENHIELAGRPIVAIAMPTSSAARCWFLM